MNFDLVWPEIQMFAFDKQIKVFNAYKDPDVVFRIKINYQRASFWSGVISCLFTTHM